MPSFLPHDLEKSCLPMFWKCGETGLPGLLTKESTDKYQKQIMKPPALSRCLKTLLLNYLAIRSFDYEDTWSSFQKHVVCTQFNIYIFIITLNTCTIQTLIEQCKEQKFLNFVHNKFFHQEAYLPWLHKLPVNPDKHTHNPDEPSHEPPFWQSGHDWEQSTPYCPGGQPKTYKHLQLVLFVW